MSFQTIGRVFLSLCEATDSPVALGLWMRFKYAQKELAEKRILPSDYNEADVFRKDYMLGSFLRKFKGLSTGIDLEDVALQKFSASEDQCRATNERLRKFSDDPHGSRANTIMYYATRKIAKILGPFKLDSVLRRCEWTGGSTTDVSKRAAFVDTKMSQLPIAVTSRALPYFRLEIERDMRWCEAILGFEPEGPLCFLPDTFKVEDGCRVTTVPKDSTTDRVIAIEPRGNIFLQKGVGNFIRERLRKFGIDLSKQETNQEWARLAYDLGLATIDLSSASDTVARELVKQLLPFDWYNYLNNIRSHSGLVRKKRVQFEKFSSMGNGFTFELETMIFYALASAVQDHMGVDWKLTSVYGDDIIVPKDVFTETVDILSYAGFDVNVKKSYWEGNFFESCGRHFFKGDEVTPVFQKEVLDEVEAIRCANRLIRWATMYRYPVIVKKAWYELRNSYRLLSDYRLPLLAEGDDGWLWPLAFGRKADPVYGYRCKVLRFVKKVMPSYDRAMLAYSLRKMSWRSTSLYSLTREYSPRDLRHSSSLDERIGFLFVEIVGDSSVVEVESARFTAGRRWVTISGVESSTLF